MRQFTGHNKWLNQEPSETNEEYNKRITEWEDKETNRQFSKVAAYEEVIEILKNTKGDELTLKGLLIRMTSMKENHEIVCNDPFKYEIKWGGKDVYKLTLRK